MCIKIQNGFSSLQLSHQLPLLTAVCARPPEDPGSVATQAFRVLLYIVRLQNRFQVDGLCVAVGYMRPGFCYIATSK
jgi:hypothetical protein